MKKDFLAGVIALADENPARLVKLVRNGWPEIKAAIDQGHTLTVIHQRLVEGGVRISYRTFTDYVREFLRTPPSQRDTCKEHVHANETAPGQAKKASGTKPHPVPPEAEREPSIGEKSGSDPWGNIRDRLQENRPGFHWDEDDASPDPSKLY